MSPDTIGALLPLFVGFPLLIAGLLVTTGHRLRLHAIVNFASMLLAFFFQQIICSIATQHNQLPECALFPNPLSTKGEK